MTFCFLGRVLIKVQKITELKSYPDKSGKIKKSSHSPQTSQETQAAALPTADSTVPVGWTRIVINMVIFYVHKCITVVHTRVFYYNYFYYFYYSYLTYDYDYYSFYFPVGLFLFFPKIIVYLINIQV